MATKFYFNSYLATEAEIKEYLKDKEVGATHPLSSENKLLIKTNSGFKKEKIGNHAQYLSNANLSSVEDRVVAALNNYNQLSSVKSYTVQFSPPGQPIIINKPNNLFSFIATNKNDGYYFDFVVYYTDRNGIIQTTTFNFRGSRVGFEHSGDIGSLLHTLKLDFSKMPNNTQFLLAAVGYNRRQIRYFQDQVPVFFVVDHERQTINCRKRNTCRSCCRNAC